MRWKRPSEPAIRSNETGSLAPKPAGARAGGRRAGDRKPLAAIATRLDSNRGALTKRVAVMQPYFFPYGGYFRLFAAVDQFVVFDCVQFPRRGRVHRSQVPGPGGGREWLTLPLARQPRDVRICDLAFASDARDRFDRSLERYPWLRPLVRRGTLSVRCSTGRWNP